MIKLFFAIHAIYYTIEFINLDNAMIGKIYRGIILIEIVIKRCINFRFFNELYIQTLMYIYFIALMFSLTKSNFHCNSFALVSISCITDLANLSFSVSLDKYFRYGIRTIVFMKIK
jgi:hypothetical protein